MSKQLNNSRHETNATENELLCKLFSGVTWKCDLVLSTKRTACSLSIAGSLFVLFLIVLFKKYRDPSQRMIANLSMSCVIFTIFMFVDGIVYENNTRCRIQGFLLNVSVWNDCLWILSIMTNMYLKVVFHVDITRYEKALTLFCWLFPWTVSSLPWIEDAYGPAGVWCWIKNVWKWRLGAWYWLRISSVLFIIATTIHITIIMYKLRRAGASTVRMLDNIKDDIRTLRAYPVVYFFFNLFPIIDRIHNAVKNSPDQQGYIFALIVFQSICDPLFGAAISLTYVLDSRTRSRLTRKHFREALQRWRKDRASIKEYSLSNTVTSGHSTPQTSQLGEQKPKQESDEILACSEDVSNMLCTSSNV